MRIFIPPDCFYFPFFLLYLLRSNIQRYVGDVRVLIENIVELLNKRTLTNFFRKRDFREQFFIGNCDIDGVNMFRRLHTLSHPSLLQYILT